MRKSRSIPIQQHAAMSGYKRDTHAAGTLSVEMASNTSTNAHTSTSAWERKRKNANCPACTSKQAEPGTAYEM